MGKRTEYTGLILSRGWSVQAALKRWDRSDDWYQRNCNGNRGAQNRLTDMIEGLEYLTKRNRS